MKNLCSKVIGGKMKKKEDVGDGDQPIPADVVDKLGECTAEQLEVGTGFCAYLYYFQLFFVL